MLFRSVQNGLFTTSQLSALGGVAPTVALAPNGAASLSWVRDMDVKLAWRHTFFERLTVEPSVGFYNVFNLANFDPPVSQLSGALTGAACSINGTVRHISNAATQAQFDCPSNRVGLGTGVFGLGAPRQIEFNLRISF